MLLLSMPTLPLICCLLIIICKHIDDDHKHIDDDHKHIDDDHKRIHDDRSFEKAAACLPVFGTVHLCPLETLAY